tara:strand:- start:198 stop:1088 length:891 start_codon:yes stop_codon:yes gene_type:complete
MEKIVFISQPCGHYPHFVHYLQYLYWCVDIILNNNEYNCIIVEPSNKSTGRFIISFKKHILEKIKNIEFLSKEEYNTIEPTLKIVKVYHFKVWPYRETNFNLNNKIIKNNILDWFPNNNSNLMRDLFFTPKNNGIKIGLVNRQRNRILLNSKELCDKIKEKFGIPVDITFFEDKSFEYQTEFFNDHKIIISPHGAQLSSIPFSQDDSLIIECAHEEWHPYHYFPGLSVTSNKYHYMICDDHTVFPTFWSDKYINPARGRSNNSKLNITVNVEKVINIIDNFLKNGNKLSNYNCNLV